MLEHIYEGSQDVMSLTVLNPGLIINKLKSKDLFDSKFILINGGAEGVFSFICLYLLIFITSRE
jgi:hypothetical protein